jgi:hypothetical protein
MKGWAVAAGLRSFVVVYEACCRKLACERHTFRGSQASFLQITKAKRNTRRLSRSRGAGTPAVAAAAICRLAALSTTPRTEKGLIAKGTGFLRQFFPKKTLASPSVFRDFLPFIFGR